MTILTDYAAVKAVLETSSLSGKYRSGATNVSADALFRSPQGAVPTHEMSEYEVQVAVVQSPVKDDNSIHELLGASPTDVTHIAFAVEQNRDPELLEIKRFIQLKELPEDERRARRIAIQRELFVLEENTLYYLNLKQGHRKRVAVPCHLRHRILSEHHSLVLVDTSQ